MIRILLIAAVALQVVGLSVILWRVWRVEVALSKVEHAVNNIRHHIGAVLGAR